jgi:hypothetical protein
VKALAKSSGKLTEELTNFVKINKDIGKPEYLEYKLTNINIVAIILFVLIS